MVRRPGKPELGRKLRELRERQGLTQAYVAAKLHIKDDKLRRYEVGEQSPTLAELRMLIEILAPDDPDERAALYQQAFGELPIVGIEYGQLFSGGPAGYLSPIMVPPPPVIIGREDDLRTLKSRLGVKPRGKKPDDVQVVTTVRGWPGVGKTTLVSALAYEPEIAIGFPDGVLWTSLGEKPNVLSKISNWGIALGISDIVYARTLEDVITRLRAVLHNKRVLLIVDDVWKVEDAVSFQVGGSNCATLLTTRFSDVAQALASAPDDVYLLDVLTEEKGLELLKRLAPAVVEKHPVEALDLVHDLEGLPLALQVAGRLLRAEARLGWGITELLTELHEGTKLLEAPAPPDRVDMAGQTTPTVAVLLERSTDRLEPEIRNRFAFLGAFAPKPATFDLEALSSVWEVTDPRPTTRVLVDRGLLEPMGSGRFQMHALLVMHAKSLLTER